MRICGICGICGICEDVILPERKQICGAAARGRDRGRLGPDPGALGLLNPDTDPDPDPDPEDSGPGATATRGV